MGNWLIGGIVGGLVGGISAALQGENIFAGAVQGAATGVIAGLAVDTAMFLAGTVIATCGTAAVVIVAGASFAGGAAGSVVGDELNARITTGHFVPIDKSMRQRAIMNGVVNIFAGGYSSYFAYADDGVHALKSAFNGMTKLKYTDGASAFAATHFSCHSTILAKTIKE